MVGMANIRQSNIELLRMLCMFYIVLHHVIVHALPMVPDFSIFMGAEWYFLQLLNAFCFVAVNVFILISGYFGIKVKFKGFLRLYIMCAFYSCILYHLHLYEIGSHINRWSLYNTIFPFSYNPGWWFVMCYLLLYLISPILNSVIETCSKKKYQYVLLLATIVIVYFGFYRDQDFVNYGFSLYHFAYLYLIGGYLRRYVSLSSKTRFYSIFVYVLGSILMWGNAIIAAKYNVDTHVWFRTLQYNHPMLIINSIALLLFVLSFDFNSKVINFLAPSSLAVYLIHDNNYFRDTIYSYISGAYIGANQGGGRLLVLFAATACIWIMGYVIDVFRRGLTFPIEKRINEFYETIKTR